MKQSGADVLRLWVSMVDYREDIRLGKEILARVVEAYRKFRNVIRVLMANLYDFDPATDAVPPSRMLEIDRWAMARYAAVATQDRRRLRRLRLSDRVSGRERVHHSGHERVLRGRHQGPDVHARRQIRGASIRPDGDVPHRRRTGAAAGADPAVHDGRGLAQSAGAARSVGPPGALPDGARGVDGRGSARSVGAAERGARSSQCGPRRKAAAESDHLVAVGQGQPRGGRAAGSRCSNDYRDELPTIFGVSHVDLDVLPTADGGSPDGVQVTVARADGVKCERCWRFVAGGERRGCVQGIMRSLH